MATIISTRTTGGGGASITGDTSGILQLASADGTTAVTIDASQNVGLGTASPALKLDVVGSVQSQNPSYAAFQLKNSGLATNPYYRIAYDSANNLVFNNVNSAYTASTEQMRIDSSGNVLVGVTSGSGTKMQVVADSGNVVYFRNTSGTGIYLVSGANSWSAASDETLKTDLKPIENGLDKVTSLRSVTGRFKTDAETISRSFLIAQDVQKVLPEAISETPEGYLGVAYTDVIPLLVASIKELKAIIDTQQTQITALEAK